MRRTSRWCSGSCSPRNRRLTPIPRPSAGSRHSTARLANMSVGGIDVLRVRGPHGVNLSTEWRIRLREVARSLIPCTSDPTKLLDPLVSADLPDVQAVLVIDPATVRPELELPGFLSLLAPCAELLASRAPDFDPASADDV